MVSKLDLAECRDVHLLDLCIELQAIQNLSREALQD